MCEKPTVAVFDFDGTLIRKDSFLEFIKFAFGKRAFLTGFFLNSPYLVAFKLKLYPNWKAKERVFSYFFRGMSYEQFCRLGRTLPQLCLLCRNRVKWMRFVVINWLVIVSMWSAQVWKNG